MRIKMPLIVLAAVLVAPAAFAQTTNSGAGTPGMSGNKSGPAVTPSGKNTSEPNNSANPDASKVQGLPGNKSGPAAQPPKQQQ
jgi:hypothetical protein